MRIAVLSWQDVDLRFSQCLLQPILLGLMLGPTPWDHNLLEPVDSIITNEKEVPLALFGLQGDQWEVRQVEKAGRHQHPQPTQGINFMRNGMGKDEWLSNVARLCDIWLLSFEFYLASLSGFFGEDERQQLFDLINELPTIEGIVTGKEMLEMQPMQPMEQDKKEEAAEKTPCNHCGANYIVGEFWIACDSCDGWYHGECVDVTEEMAEYIGKYKCPSCPRKKSRKS